MGSEVEEVKVTSPFDVSVVIPTFNRAELVVHAIQSAIDAGNGIRTEILVVDDGSQDDTLERVAAFGEQIAVVALSRNVGRNRARNEGLRAARGEWIKFLDSDDRLEAGALAQEVAAGRRARADIVATAYRRAELSGGEVSVHLPPPFAHGLDSLLRGEGVPTSAALYRRAALGAVEWNPGALELDDWEFFVMAALKAQQILPLQIVSFTWFEHAGRGSHRYDAGGVAKAHGRILARLEEALRERGELTDLRKKRLAQYRYKHLRALSLADRFAFEDAVKRILELDPAFQPREEERQRTMRCAARLVGFRRAVLLHSALKRLVTRGRAGGSRNHGVDRREARESDPARGRE